MIQVSSKHEDKVHVSQGLYIDFFLVSGIELKTLLGRCSDTHGDDCDSQSQEELCASARGVEEVEIGAGFGEICFVSTKEPL